MGLVEEIKAVYAEEEASGRLAVTLADVPHSYERITPEWMSELLCTGTPGAKVEKVTLGEASSGSSNRQRIFLEYDDAGRAAGLPLSVFCKGSVALANRVLLGMSLTARGEPHFFNRIRDRVAIQVPNAIHAAYDDRTHAYIIVMDDMTDTAEFFDETTRVDKARATEMTELLARLHGTFYESPELGSPSIPFMHWPEWWTHMVSVASDYGDACDEGFAAAKDVIPARLFARSAEIWPATMEAAARHATLPRTLMHCDVHLKNWFHFNGKVGLCDWQIMNVGHWSRDFIYAMTTALAVEDRRNWLPDLLRHYLGALQAAGGERIGYDEALTLCRQQLASALAFWTITLRPAKDMPPMQPDSTSLCFIERMTAAMDDLDALDAF